MILVLTDSSCGTNWVKRYENEGEEQQDIFQLNKSVTEISEEMTYLLDRTLLFKVNNCHRKDNPDRLVDYNVRKVCDYERIILLYIDKKAHKTEDGYVSTPEDIPADFDLPFDI